MNKHEKEYSDGISQSLGIKIDNLPDEVVEEIDTIEQKTIQVQESIENNLVLIKDQSFIDFELKNLISRTNTTLEKLESDIKIGSAPRMYEVYATLVNTKRELLKELITFNKLILDMTMFSGKEGEDEDDEKEKNNFNLTSDQLIDLINSAKDKSELNSIDATFEIEDVDV